MSNSSRQPKRTRRQFLRTLASGAIAASGTALVGCGGPANVPAADAPSAAPTTGSAAAATAPAVISGNVTVTVMHARNELTEKMQQEFEAANPNIKIEFIEFDQTRLFAMASAGNLPDIFRTMAPDVPQYLARNLLLDLTPYFESSSLINMSNFAPANNYYRAEDPTKIGSGKLYGMVKDWSPDLTVFINTKAFEEVGLTVPDPAKPISYDELADFAKKLTKIEGDRTARWGLAFANDWNWIDRVLMNLLAEKNVSLFADDFTSINLVNNDEARKAARYYFDLAQAKATSTPLNPSPSWGGEDFTKGLAAMVQYGYWFSAMAESDITKGNVVMLPAPTWAGQRRSPTITATGAVISAKTKNPDAAWKVFEWYHGGQPSVERAKSGWGVPALQSQYDLVPKETPFQKQANSVLQEELKYADVQLQFNPYLGGDTVPTIWLKHLEPALRGTISFDEMLQNVENETNAAIEDGRERVG